MAHPNDQAVRSEALVVVGPNKVRLLRDGSEAYPAMLAAIAEAKHEVLLEMYWFGSDAIGREFSEALASRARAGVIVRVVCDAFGSSPTDPDMFATLTAAGGDVRFFRPLATLFRSRLRWFRRDHRKLLVCDRTIGFTGGINIGRPWAPTQHGGEGWRDDMVEVQGPAATELRVVFYEVWRILLKRPERRDPKLLPRDIGVLPPRPESDAWVIASRRRPTRRAIRATYLRWICGAEKAIDIVNAYFVPDRRIRRALINAARRGVAVRVIVPESSDLPFVQWAVEATLERLVGAGVRAFAFRGPILHCKTAAVDGNLVTIGSYNLDYRSYLYNLEVNLAVRSESFASVVHASIDSDVVRSVAWTQSHLLARGTLRRWLGEFAYLFAPFL